MKKLTLAFFLIISIPGWDQVRERARLLDTVYIHFNPDHPVNKIVPQYALGAGIDGQYMGDNAIFLSPGNIDEMKSAGLQSLTYRLRTELGQEVWHWNPSGHWSEKGKRQGYWVSDTTSEEPINVSYGYNLPRRGSTFDQANNNGYSRIDDGNLQTYWKSNPYLDKRFTYEADSIHPQWVAIDLGRKRWVNTLIIYWGDPFAVSFRIEFVSADAVDKFNHVTILDPYGPNDWHLVPGESIANCKGGKLVIQFPGKPLKLRILRILCLVSSGTAIPGSDDKRDSCGYAVREVKLGITKQGHFIDYINHGITNTSQSAVFVSSTDLWHRATDIDRNTEQPGIDFVFRNNLNNNLPALLPLGVLYDTPDNALNLLYYISARKYPCEEVELGEEPDGQYISPKDFATLYIRLASMIKSDFPGIKTGGPSFQGISPAADSADEFTEHQWLKAFINYLQEKNSSGLFHFFSFEWYPVDDVCKSSSRTLNNAHQLMKESLNGILNGLLSPGFPVYITEYGYSVLAGEPEEQINAGLLNADIVGQFLSMGGTRAYLYGYEPGFLSNDNGCSWGELMILGLNDDNKIAYKTATFYSAQLYAKYWAEPANGTLNFYRVTTSFHKKNGQAAIKAYALKRPNGKWGIMLINENPAKTLKAVIQVKNEMDSVVRTISGPVEIFQFGPEQYQWISNRDKGHPSPDNPPVKIVQSNFNEVLLAPSSITIVNER
jgi:hypothetical protein